MAQQEQQIAPTSALCPEHLRIARRGPAVSRTLPPRKKGKGSSVIERSRTLSPRRLRRRDRTRSALRQAARSVLERKGYVQTTIRDIVSEADITHRTYYYYYESKDAVLGELVDKVVDEFLAAAIPLALNRMADDDPRVPSIKNRFRLAIRALLAVAERNRQLMAAIRQATHINEDLAHRWERFRRSILEPLERDLAWGREKGLLADHSRVIAVAIGASLEGILFEFAATGSPPASAFEDAMTEFYWNALYRLHEGADDYIIVPGGRLKPVFSSDSD